MSEGKTMKFRFNDKEITVPIYPTFKECFASFQKNFSINDEDAKKLLLFYYDSDGDQISFQIENDYSIFVKDDSPSDKIIEGEISEKEKDASIYIEPPDTLKSGRVFKKPSEQNGDLNLKNFDNSSFLGNSAYSIENLNNEMVFQKKNKDEDAINKGINEINIMMNKSNEGNKNENLIELMKKQMDDMIKKHQEELRKKDEENEKKYKDALAQKEKELNKKMEEKEKKLNEDRLKKENEIKEKYENEMKSNIQIKQKELEEMRSKIQLEKKKLDEIQKKEIENQKKIEEMKKKEEENLKKFNELKKLEEEKIKKIEEEKLKI